MINILQESEAVQTGGGVITNSCDIDNIVPGAIYYIAPNILVTFPDFTSLNQTIIEDGWKKIIIFKEQEIDGN